MRVRRLQFVFIPWFFVLALCLVSGCALPSHVTQRPSDPVHLAGSGEGASKTVYVVGHGWHTGLVLRTSDISPEVVPEIRDFEHTHFVKLGWGDEGFYRAKCITIPLALRAAFWPTPSVLHVAGFRGSVKRFYEVSDIVEVKLSDDQFDNMCRFVADTCIRRSDNKAGGGEWRAARFHSAQMIIC